VDVAKTMLNLAVAHYNLGDRKQAKKMFEVVLEIFYRFYTDPDHPNIKMAKMGLAAATRSSCIIS
jgi:hypothetical protein